MKKLLALLLAVGLVANVHSANVLAGGQIPLINNVVGMGVLTLDFSSAGVDQRIATIIVNNNSTSFDVDITATNLANFRNGAGVDIVWTACNMTAGGLGTLGTGAAVPNENMLAGLQGAGYQYNSGAQTTATQNYSM